MGYCMCIACIQKLPQQNSQPLSWNELIVVLSFTLLHKHAYRTEKIRQHLKRTKKRLAQDKQILKEISEIEETYPGAWEEIRRFSAPNTTSNFAQF